MTLDLVAFTDMGQFRRGREEEGGTGAGGCRIDRGNWNLSL